MDASDRGVLLNRLADLMERDRIYLSVINLFLSQIPNFSYLNFFFAEFRNT